MNSLTEWAKSIPLENLIAGAIIAIGSLTAWTILIVQWLRRR